MNDGYGFLRSEDGNFTNSSNDTYVSSTQIKKFALKKWRCCNRSGKTAKRPREVLCSFKD